jgi:preprotein translocase subunit SecD
MKQHLLLRVGISLCVLAISAVFLLPNFALVRESPLGAILPDKKIGLGLDLMGGIYLNLGVEVDKAVENSLVQVGQEIRNIARSNAVQITTPRPSGNRRLEFFLPEASRENALNGLIRRQYPDEELYISREGVPSGGIRFLIGFTPEQIKKLESNALDMALTTIRNRIDQFGVAEPDIRKQVDYNRIIVQLPGIDDTRRAIQIIGQTAQLEFHIEYDAGSLDMSRVERGTLPPDALRIPLLETRGGESHILVRREAALTGEYIEDARQSYDDNNRPAVSLTFDRRGSIQFERITGENVKRRMAIVLDGVAHSAPTIQEKISGGKASITGSFTVEEANDLALVLRAGSLPAPVTVLEERTVGPSLGQESIDQGIKASVVGVILVMAFMLAYYSVSGAIATAMMLLDIGMILSGMTLLGATLTLPGIAGIVLTIGMAVDANVLIFERIREELRQGAFPFKAVQLGFSKASVSIFDANLTTIIATVILYQFGTGPVRGFAVTLTLGILISMFTAVFVSRAVFDLWITKNSIKIRI